MHRYACVAAYYALYKAGRFSFYLLVPRHTPAYSLCANAMFVARFAPPLAFHYIYALALPPGGQEGSPVRGQNICVSTPMDALRKQDTCTAPCSTGR